MKLKELVANRGLKHAWLASQIGILAARMSMILGGRSALPITSVPHLADLLGVEISDVINAHIADLAETAAARKARRVKV